MSDLGLKSGLVRLVPYNKKWPLLFEHEANLLQLTLDIARDKIQHVGSTSIPGMIAKPILDIAMLVDSLDVVEDWRKPLSKIGYWYKGIEPDLTDRRFFAKGPRSKRTVYIHVVNQKEYDSLIKFRDTLRSNPDLVEEYTKLKQALARAHSEDRDTYTSSKNEFIRGVLGQ